MASSATVSKGYLIILIANLIMGLILYHNIGLVQNGGVQETTTTTGGLLVEQRGPHHERLPHSDQDDTSEREMMCVIYAGPHKTGSSSLERYIHSNKGAMEALEKDNYRFPLPKQSIPLFAQCLRVMTRGINLIIAMAYSMIFNRLSAQIIVRRIF